ncbi:MAG TPA: hypothetical protein VMW25_05195, partial [Clostridia bacterium]|nr:hypothetical protein [Clostridia bacterium]
WQNVTALHPEDCRCHPCHKLVYVDTCPSGKITGRPRCAENIKPETVFRAIETYYKAWKNGNGQIEQNQKLPKVLRRKNRKKCLKKSA